MGSGGSLSQKLRPPSCGAFGQRRVTFAFWALPPRHLDCGAVLGRILLARQTQRGREHEQEAWPIGTATKVSEISKKARETLVSTLRAYTRGFPLVTSNATLSERCWRI